MTSREAIEDIILYLNATEPKGLYCENIEIIKKDLEILEIIKKHKLLNYVIKNEKCANMYHLSKEEIDLLRELEK